MRCINNSLYLARKYAGILVHGRNYLLRETEPRGTDNVQGQISKHIFAPNGGYSVYYPDPDPDLKIGEHPRILPSFS